MAAGASSPLEQAGELKFGQVGIANLRIKQLDIARLGEEMAERVQRAPKMFERAAVVVDFGSLSTCPDATTARALLDALRAAGVRPVSLAFGTTEIERLSRELDLPLLAKFRAQFESERRDEPVEQPPPEKAPPAAPAKDDRAAEPAPTRQGQTGQIHLQPVRSGQQLYAAGRDLTVVNTVGTGAEVIADGSVHVYGTLRGRALAGASGDVNARIFCREFHAELVAIAGQYRVIEELPSELRGRPVQVWLEGDKLRLEELG